MSSLARRYARALFEVADAAGAVDAVAADLQQVRAVLAEPGIRGVVLDPQTPRQTRAAVLEKLVAGGHELSRNLIGVVLQRRREAILPDLDAAFAAMVRQARGEVEGVVESAQPLDEGQLGDLERSMAAAVGKQVSLRLEVNSDLIGGVRVRVGNTLYDGSVATALDELGRRLMEAPVP